MKFYFATHGKDFPDMLNHIERVKKYIKEKYNKEIITLKSDKSFDYYMFEHEKQRGKNKRKKRLWLGYNEMQVVY